MKFKILLLVGVCLKIATTFDCNQSTDLSIKTLDCCLQAWDEIDLSNDTCFVFSADHDSEECMLDCFYKKHGFLIDGTIVEENGKKYLRTFGHKEFEDTFIPAFERCNKFDWDELTAKFGNLVGNHHGKCSPKGYIFDSCIALNVISRCPNHMLIKTEYCSAQKTFLNECIFIS